MELSKEEAEINLRRLTYNTAGFKIHEERLAELIAAEDAAVYSLTLKPLSTEQRDELNLHIARRQGLLMALTLKEEALPDSDTVEVESV